MLEFTHPRISSYRIAQIQPEEMDAIICLIASIGEAVATRHCVSLRAAKRAGACPLSYDSYLKIAFYPIAIAHAFHHGLHFIRAVLRLLPAP